MSILLYCILLVHVCRRLWFFYPVSGGCLSAACAAAAVFSAYDGSQGYRLMQDSGLLHPKQGVEPQGRIMKQHFRGINAERDDSEPPWNQRDFKHNFVDL